MAGSPAPIQEQQDQPSPFGPGVPPMPPDATPEQKDAHWYKHVYQGDKVPQLTVRAVVFGGILGMLMAAANLYTTLAIGWAFGVAITAGVMSFVTWGVLRTLTGGRISQMSILENNCMQSTASAAGYSTGSTIATMFGALLLLEAIPDGKTAADVKSWAIPSSPIWAVALFTLCTGLMGVFLAIPLKRQMINHEQLRFPSGVAAAETLRSLYSQGKEAIQKAYALVGGMAVGAVVGILNTGEGTLKFLDRILHFRLPEQVPADGLMQIHGVKMQSMGFESSGLLIAAGIITRMRVCLSLMAGSLLLYLVVVPALVAADVKTPGSGWVKDAAGAFVYDRATISPEVHANLAVNGAGMFRITTWSLWGGTALMVVSSLTAVALQWRTIARAFTSLGSSTEGDASSAGQRAIEVPFRWMVVGMVPITVAMLFVQMVAFDISWWAGLIAIAMSGVLSLVASRATGETDTTPIGAMGKVMQLTFAIFHPGQIVPNLASAGIAANSASSSADLLTDLKSGYLLGANPRRQFLAQFFGVFFGTLAIVPIWFLMVPNKEALEKFAAPATRQWEAVARVLTKGVETLPESAKFAIVIGAAVGILLPLIDRFAPSKLRPYLPSAMGLGLSWVVPFANALGFMVGALVIFIWERINRRHADKYAVAVSSGLIAGESLIKAVIAMAATALGLMGMN